MEGESPYDYGVGCFTFIVYLGVNDWLFVGAYISVYSCDGVINVWVYTPDGGDIIGVAVFVGGIKEG